MWYRRNIKKWSQSELRNLLSQVLETKLAQHWNLFFMTVSDILCTVPEGCVLVGPRNSQAMYLVSNKVASNWGKITVFLHLSYNYLCTYMPSLIAKIWTSQNCLAWKMKNKKCQIPAKPFWASPVLPGIWDVWHFLFRFSYSYSTEWRQSQFCILKWRIFSR